MVLLLFSRPDRSLQYHHECCQHCEFGQVPRASVSPSITVRVYEEKSLYKYSLFVKRNQNVAEGLEDLCSCRKVKGIVVPAQKRTISNSKGRF